MDLHHGPGFATCPAVAPGMYEVVFLFKPAVDHHVHSLGPRPKKSIKPTTTEQVTWQLINLWTPNPTANHSSMIFLHVYFFNSVFMPTGIAQEDIPAAARPPSIVIPTRPHARRPGFKNFQDPGCKFFANDIKAIFWHFFGHPLVTH
jgi:hypothetical protein